MQNKKVVAVVVIILLIGLIAWYFNSLEQKVPSPPVSSPSVVSADQQAVALETKQKTDIKKLIDLAKEAPEKLKELMMSSPKMAAMDAMGKAMNASFQFYGKIIDQHGDAVPDVKIKYSMLGFGSFGQPGVNVKRAQSDANGMFVLSGNGSRFSFRSLNKKGYEFDQVPSYNTYPSTKGMKLKYKGTPEKPVVIQAWKKVESESLYHGKILQKFQQDGQFHSVDIPALNGTMKVAFTIDPAGDKPNPLDWSVKLRVERGGVFETTDLFMNEAPTNGFQGEWVGGHKKGEKEFSRDENKKFYFTALNGALYGRMEVTIRAYYGYKPTKAGLGYVGVKYWVNPNGSRNLQYDPAKRIYPK